MIVRRQGYLPIACGGIRHGQGVVFRGTAGRSSDRRINPEEAVGISPTATTRSVLGGSLQGNDLLGDSLPELIEVIHCDANARAPITKNEIAANFLAILAVGIIAMGRNTDPGENSLKIFF